MDSHPRPNVVWLTIDSIRADHTTMDGYRRDTTLNMATLGAAPDGVAFSNAIAAAKWSLGSVASMQTCTYPEYNLAGFRTEALSPDVPTVAEAFAEAGYFTAGVSANGWFCDETGLDRGFEYFNRIHAGNFLTAAGPLATLGFVRNLRRHSGGFATDPLKHRPDYLVNRDVERVLRRAKADDRPFYLAVHYHGAHIPYYPPVAYQERFLSEIGVSRAEALEVAFRLTTDINSQIARTDQFTDRDWAILSAMYDALLAYCDDLANEVVEMVRDVPNTVVVITADHGDLLGEYGLLAHKLVLHDALIRVPLVVSGLPELKVRSDEIVQHVDVMRTLLVLAGADAPHFQGLDLLSGDPPREFAIAQRGAGGEDGLGEIHDYNPEFDGSVFHTGEMTALRTGEWKYLESDDRVELFALPDEFTDVSDEHPDLVASFGEQVAAWRADHQSAGLDLAAAEADFSTEARQRLADLGYLAE
jgi:uncharacterized sulfatase